MSDPGCRQLDQLPGFLEALVVLGRLGPVLWPGWEPLRQPALIVVAGGGYVLLGTGVLPPSFAKIRLPGPSDEARGEEPLGWAAGPVPLAAVLPGTLAGEYRIATIGERAVPVVGPLRGPVDCAFVGQLARDLFRAQVAVRLAADMDVLAGLDDEDREELYDARLHDLDLSDPAVRIVALLAQSQLAYERYPEVSLLNNVLANLEGRLLFGHTVPDGWEPPMAPPARRRGNNPSGAVEANGNVACAAEVAGARPARAHAFALARRERHAALRPFLVAYERRLELYEGLPRYVELKLYRRLAQAAKLGLSAGDLPPGEAALAAVLEWAPAAARLAGQRVALLGKLNERGWGAARRRFHHSGMGLADLLDATVVGWPQMVLSERLPLDVVLEGAVELDGGERDERLLESARHHYQYYDRLEDERTWVRAVEERRRQLVGAVLDGPGTRVILDVSSLREKASWYDRQTAEAIGESILVHVRPGVFTYGDGSTFVEFRGTSIVEERRARLLHATVPGSPVAIWGDDERLPETRNAEFTAGLQLDLGCLRVRANRGTIQHEGGALLVRLLG